jgi:hypothetical protein
LIASGGCFAIYASDRMLIDPHLIDGTSHAKQKEIIARELSVQVFMVVVAGVLVNFTSKAFERREGLPFLNQLAAWVIACWSSFVGF